MITRDAQAPLDRPRERHRPATRGGPARQLLEALRTPSPRPARRSGAARRPRVRDGDPGAVDPAATTRTPGCARPTWSSSSTASTPQSRRADKEIADLEKTRSQLADSTQRREAALKQATDESTTLGILAGTLPPTGPGIRITVTDPEDKVSLNNLLDGIEELRDAGAEAIEFND